MVSKFVRYIDKHQLCGKHERILLAVSGGLDSVVMLDLFVRAGYKVAVAHCNFQLRGSESEQDEQFVESRCSALQVPFYSRRFDTNNYAAEKKTSIQMAARDLRYKWFTQLCREESFDCVATAHHANDNLETILIHLIRGTGISGMTGIPIKADLVIRPLLGFTRDELQAYALERKLDWREDRSNETDDYERNFIRHNILPQLRSLNPSLDEGFLQTQERLQGALTVFNHGLTALKDRFLKELYDRVTIDKAILQATPFPAVVLWEMTKKYGFNFKQIQEAVDVEEPGRKFVVGNYQLVVDRNEWIIHTPKKLEGEVQIGRDERFASFHDQHLKIELTREGAISPDARMAQLDGDSLHYPIVWRKWREGDSFCPLGMSKKKKISDFLIDNKISMADKAGVTVLESQGEIAWVVGYRIDNRFKVSQRTKEVVRITLQ